MEESVRPPRVSVIIPAYNDHTRLLALLQKLERQTYPSELVEVIVADNGSTDGTVSAVHRFAQEKSFPVRVVEEREIQSSYAARNKALEEASGEILAFTDSDCLPEENWIEEGARVLQRPGVQAAGGRVVFFFKRSVPSPIELLDSGSKLSQESYVESVGFAATANFFVKKRVVDEFGPFRTDLISGGDYEFGRRITRNGVRIRYAADAVVWHPARSTWKAILKKSRRIASGQVQLEKLGLLEHGRLGPRRVLPALRYLRSPSLSTGRRIQLSAMATLLRYLNLYWRLRAR